MLQPIDIFQGEEKGTCILNQACIQVGGLEFLKSLATLSTGYEVVCDDPTVVLVPEHGETAFIYINFIFIPVYKL